MTATPANARHAVAQGDDDPVVRHFQNCLAISVRADGNRVPGIAKGDCCIMLQLIRMKLDAFAVEIDVRNPGRFRGTAELQRDMTAVLGALPKYHIPKWGATHVRGVLRDDQKRGNKRHIIELISLLNRYSGSAESLRRAYERCITLHHEYWESFSIAVVVQPTDPAQQRLVKALSVASLGRVQQGLVYSVLRVRYGATHTITTKKTFAGDAQSSLKGKIQRGDIQVWDGDALTMVLEVKDAVVDETAWGRVAATHGAHDYPLFVLASAFASPEFKAGICRYERTYAVHLADFVLTLFGDIVIGQRRSPDEVLADVIDVYNNNFCVAVEKDKSLSLSFDEEEPQPE